MIDITQEPEQQVLDLSVIDDITKVYYINKFAEALLTKLSEAKATEQQLLARITEKDEIITQYSDSINSLTAEVTVLNSDLQSANDTISNQMTSITTLQSSLAIVENDLRNANNTISEQAGNIEELNNLVCEANNTIEAQAENIENLQLMHKDLLAELDTLSAQLSSKYTIINDLNKRLGISEVSNKELSIELANISEQASTYKIQFDQRTEELQQARMIGAAFETENIEVKETLQIRNEDLDQLSETLSLKYSTIKELNAIIDDLRAQLQAQETNTPLVAEKTGDATLAAIKERAKDIDFERIGTASADVKDDLKVIKGIGPYTEKKMNALGIYTFQQIANFEEADIDKVNIAIQFFIGRIRRDDWVGQAKALCH